MWYMVVFVFSILVRIVYGYYSHYTEDEARMWQLGFVALQKLQVINHGMPVVYSNSLIPGSFQSIVSAFPLLISRSPFCLIIFTQILNAFSQLLLYKWITHIFKEFKGILVFSFVVFAPWSLLFSYAWNPSLLPIFSMMFVWGLTFLFESSSEQSPSLFHNFKSYFLLLAPLLLTLQINLQVVCLIAFVAYLIVFKLIKRPSFLTVILTQILAFVTLLPWALYKVGKVPLDEPTWGFTHPVTHNIEFHLSHILEAPHVLLRLISFVSGDTINRFEHGFLHAHLLLFPLIVVSEIASILIILLCVTFYFSKTRYKILFNVFTFKQDFMKLSLLEKFDFVCLVLPLILIASSLFSITSLGVHSLLCLYFVGYYLFFRQLNAFSFSALMRQKKIVIPYIAVSVTCCVIAGASFRSTFNMIHRLAPHLCRGESMDNALQSAQVLIKEEGFKGNLSYTTSLLCPYYSKTF